MRKASWVVAGTLSLTSSFAAFAARGAPCDRQCLTSTVDGYVAALVAHDPKRLAVSRDLRYTENLVPLAFGREGLWATVNGRRDFNIYAADPERGDVAWIGILKENDKAVMVAVRLKVVDRSITEAEMLVGRSGLTAADTVPGPRPDFGEVIPPGERSSRERLSAIAKSNWDAMEQGNGDLAPYAVDCERYDNGHKTTTGNKPEPTSCFGQMNSGRFKNGNKVDPRRIWAVDVEHGLAVGLFTPNVPGTARQLTLRSGETLTMGADELIPFTIQQVEMFKIVRGQISKVEVVLGPRVPFGMRSPFDMKTLWQPAAP